MSPSPNLSARPVTFKPNGSNDATVGGVALSQLARHYGTPLYVMDEATIRAMAEAYRQGLADYPAEHLLMFAAKANLNMGLARLADAMGLGLDVVSGGELYTALKAGFPPERIAFNGNNKSEDELEMALTNRVARISVDNFDELKRLDALCRRLDKRADIFIRVAPGIEAHTHDYIRTGQSDSKFGIDISELSKAIDLLVNEYTETLNLRGLHAHIGSQIFDTEPYLDLCELLLNVIFNIRKHYSEAPNFPLDDLNLGGGLGVHYTGEDDPPDVTHTIQALADKTARYAQQLGMSPPRLLLEPGRSLVATAGLTLYTLGTQKHVPDGSRNFVAVDGGMGDNIRPALYQAKYDAMLVSGQDRPVSEHPWRVVGKYCESGDVILPEISLPEPQDGDLLVVFGTGAYNASMAMAYNRIGRPAMVLVENGRHHLLVARESQEDLVARDHIPSHLAVQHQEVTAG